VQVLALYAPYANQFSAAYFDPEERKIHVLEDTKDTWGWDLATLCKLKYSREADE
jgi:DNA mismatch repair protein MSH5